MTTSTTRDIQRATFIDSLHNSLKRQASEAIEEQGRILRLATNYVEDGLEESECIELLMIDGLSREAAESYTSMALSEEEEEVNNLTEYSFQFEDDYGKVWSSYDIGETVRALDETDALEKADELLFASASVNHNKVLSVSRIS